MCLEQKARPGKWPRLRGFAGFTAQGVPLDLLLFRMEAGPLVDASMAPPGH